MNTLHGIKTLAAMAIAIAVPGTSAAVTLSENGLGQGLLFPYYTVEGGQSTSFAVRNTTASGKALKVRVLESYAGRDVLAFNVYLAPYATWTTAMIKDMDSDDGGIGALLQFTAGTCTAFPGLLQPNPLRSNSYTGDNQDGGPSDRSRTRQGQIEIIEMGTLAESLLPIVSVASPPNCNILRTRFSTGNVWGQPRGASNEDILPPTGGLRGDAIVVNVEGGTAFSYRALAFNGLASTARHTFAPSPLPRLYDIPTEDGADIPVTLVDGEGNAQHLSYPAGRGMDAISALLTFASVSSSYSVTPQLAARTDWLLSFPTRYAYVDDAPNGTLPPQTFPIAPFVSRRCEEARLSRYDGGGRKLSTAANEAIDLCTQAQTLRFRHGSTDSPLVAGADGQLISADGSGTAVLDLGTLEGDARLLRPDTNGRCVRGLPVWLLSVTAYDNSSAQPARIATYPETRVGTGKRVIEDC